SLLTATLFLVARQAPILDQWARPSRGRAAARGAFAAALGLGLAAWALVPMIELLLHSERRTSLSAVDREFGAAGLPALVSAVGLSFGGIATDYLPSVYIGPLVLFAAAAAYFERQRRPLIWLVSLIGLVGLLLAAAGPP